MFARATEQIEPTKCFVIMPFKAEYDEIYQEIIKPLIQNLGFSCLRADEIYRSTSIIEDIWRNIQTAGIIIADLTGRNANVFYELGLAHAIGKEVILITQSMEDVPFDLRHIRCLVYKQSLRGARQLADDLRNTITGIPAFARLSVEFLTDRFLNRFQSREVSMIVKFDMPRGQRTVVTERYESIPKDSGLTEYYKKLQVPGQVREVKFDSGDVDIKTLFPGLYLISARFNPPVQKSQEKTFQLEYVLEKCFTDENEYWFFNADSLTEHFIAQFEFSRSSNVRDFKVLEKVEGKETLYPIQPVCRNNGNLIIYSWEIGPISPPTCCMFRWRWD